MNLFFTGAGISAESGIATYRGAGGVYNNTNIADILEKSVYDTTPEKVHEVLDEMSRAVFNAEPNLAHLTLAQFQKTHGGTIVTQNIDDLFERAGCTDVIHVHGELTKQVCRGCNQSWDVELTHPERHCPCPTCGTQTRYGVVLFGEMAPAYETFNWLLKQLHAGDTFTVIGTSGNVIPVNSLVKKLTYKSVRTFLNNYDTQEYVRESLFTHVYMGKATEMVPKICACIAESLT